MITAWALIIQLAASSAMAAIAWFVQVVHYPLFGHVSPAPPVAGEPDTSARRAAADYHEENVRRTRPLVLVPMACEAFTAAWLAVFPPAPIGRAATLAGLVLVAIVILSTALVQVPLHARLRSGDVDRGTIESLVRSTRLRTAAWTARMLLAAWMLHAVSAPA